ncbi:MAG: hypothetical protein JXQ82_07870 [Methanomicrobiaceae archaeon]|nr:hypothetical protein [Methanomicrobiaceae archaeon]
MSLAARTAEYRPPNEDALRGIMSSDADKEEVGELPVYLLSSVIKGLTTKHGNKIVNIQIHRAKSNQYRVTYSLNDRYGGALND